MPGPLVLVGIPFLGTLLGGLLLKLFELFTRVLAKKFALVAAGVIAAGAATAAFVSAMYALATSISASIPSELFAHVGLFIPSNAATCIGVLVSARVATWVYWWGVQVINWKLTANL